MKLLTTIRDGIRELRAQPRIFFTLCALAAIMLFTYGLARPPAKSMFTDVHGSAALPVAWLAVAGLTVVAAMTYGWFVRRMATPKLFFAATIVIAVVFTALRIAIGAGVPYAVFALFVVMETYIVVLVESFWSLANLSYKLSSARVAYGMFLVCGSLGALTAETLQPTFARVLGTANIIWFVGPVLVLCGAWCSRLAAPSAHAPAPVRQPPAITRREGWMLVLRSRYLWLLVLIVAAAQIAITMADYTLSSSLETTYPGAAMRDARTAAFGTVYATINVSAIVLQLLTAPLVGALGVLPILIAIPALVGSAMGAAVALPRAFMSSLAFVLAKVFDYSLFRATKEMLYLPLDAQSKTVGKSYVDMGTYRAAKAIASLLLIALVPFGPRIVGVTIVTAAAIWLACTLVLAPRYRAELRGKDDSA